MNIKVSGEASFELSDKVSDKVSYKVSDKSSATALCVGIAGIGLLGPGLPDWGSAVELLRDPTAWRPRPTEVAAPLLLPATERRRAGKVVKASIAVAEQACAMAGLDPSTLATVFTSSSGDPDNCHALCEALATPERAVSPTRFTNSVHNATAGYWHIAVRSRRPSTSLAAFDGGVGAGLLEAAVQCHGSGQPVLLVACDLPYPEPLASVRPVSDGFAFALLLVPANAPALQHLRLELNDGEPATRCTNAALERLRQGVPAARALPLLEALAGVPALGSAAALCIEAQAGCGIRLWLQSVTSTTRQPR